MYLQTGKELLIFHLYINDKSWFYGIHADDADVQLGGQPVPKY